MVVVVLLLVMEVVVVLVVFEMAGLWKCWFDSFGGIVVRELSCSWLVCPWVAPSVS